MKAGDHVIALRTFESERGTVHAGQSLKIGCVSAGGMFVQPCGFPAFLRAANFSTDPDPNLLLSLIHTGRADV